MLSSTIFYALYASTLCAYISILSLMASWMSSHVTTSLKIAPIMVLPFSPPMNCSVSNWWYSLYSQSVAFVCSPPIHSWVESLLFLCRFWYYSDITIQLYHGLNLLLKTEKRPFAVLHFAFSSWMNFFITYRPSWPNHFNHLVLFLIN